MKYCTHCGKEVLDDAVICPNCGCSVQDTHAQQQTYAPQAPQTESYTTMSIVGFIFALLGGLLGLILSIVAYKGAKEEGNKKSMSLSKAGIIIAGIEIGITVVLYVIIISVGLGSFLAF